jgi:hypothetical protein
LEAVSKEKGYGKAMTYWENCLVGLGSYEVSQLKFFWQQQLQQGVVLAARVFLILF